MEYSLEALERTYTHQLGPIDTALETFSPLTDAEINEFFDELDIDHDGLVTFEEIEKKLQLLYAELAPHFLIEPTLARTATLGPDGLPSQIHHINRSSRTAQEGLSDFLRSLLPKKKPTTSQDAQDAQQQQQQEGIDRQTFLHHVQTWNVPSRLQQDQTSLHEAALVQRIPLPRRLAAFFTVHGPSIIFISLIISLQIYFAQYYLVRYIHKPAVIASLGWPIILTKTCVGALFPTLGFMLLSMSRRLSTWCRRWKWVSRVVNWDRSQVFHQRMALVGLGLATVHSLGHLAGTFVYGSRKGRREATERILRVDAVSGGVSFFCFFFSLFFSFFFSLSSCSSLKGTEFGLTVYHRTLRHMDGLSVLGLVGQASWQSPPFGQLLSLPFLKSEKSITSGSKWVTCSCFH